MKNPRTTISGYVGFAATLLQGVGTVLTFIGPPVVGQLLFSAGACIGQLANSAGNVASKDGGR